MNDETATAVNSNMEMPVELFREGNVHPPMCRVGNKNEFVNCMKCLMASWGTPSSLVGHSHNNSTFPCPVSVKKHCAGSMRVDFGPRSDPNSIGIVGGRVGCNCLRLLREGSKLPFRGVIEKKYETPVLAACGISRYLLSYLCIHPSKVTVFETITRSDGERYYVYSLEYPSYVGGSSETLKVSTYSAEGGYYINCPLVREASAFKQRCLGCNYQPSKLKVEDTMDDEFRFMFGLSCNLHSVCERCSIKYFTSRPWKNTEANDEVESSEVSAEQFSVKHNDKTLLFCSGCNKDVGSSVIVNISKRAMLKGPVPLVWLGKKWVVSSCVRDLFVPFYTSYIKWIVDANVYVPEMLAALDEQIVEQEGSKAKIQKVTKDLGIVNRSLSLMRNDRMVLEEAKKHLDSKKMHYFFALNDLQRFPDQMVNLNSAFFEAVLGRYPFCAILSRLRFVTFDLNRVLNPSNVTRFASAARKDEAV